MGAQDNYAASYESLLHELVLSLLPFD